MTIARICPVCGGVRGFRGMERDGEHLCLSADKCMVVLLAEVRAYNDDAADVSLQSIANKSQPDNHATQ